MAAVTERKRPGRFVRPGRLLLAGLLAACGSARTPPPAEPTPEVYEQGIASWYGPGFHGRPTASGERFDQDALTAAHPRLPFGTRVRVLNLENGNDVVVRINDRGPFTGGRIIDVSRAAARVLGMIQAGTARVALYLLPPERAPLPMYFRPSSPRDAGSIPLPLPH